VSAQRKFQLYDFVLCFTNSDRITKQLEEEQQARRSAEERIKELEGKYQETRNDSGTAHTRGKIQGLVIILPFNHSLDHPTPDFSCKKNISVFMF